MGSILLEPSEEPSNALLVVLVVLALNNNFLEPICAMTREGRCYCTA